MEVKTPYTTQKAHTDVQKGGKALLFPNEGEEQLAYNTRFLFGLTLMTPEQTNVFKENVDAWIKQIRREFSELSDLPSQVAENTDNIQHNYELIYEMRDEIEELKQEINALKLIQIISLKKAEEERFQSKDVNFAQ